MLRSIRTPLVLVVLAAAGAAAATARADAEPVGPPLGNATYLGRIANDADVDDFTGRFLVGETIQVTVTATKDGKVPPTLKPLVVLVDPDGLERAAGVTTSPSGLVMSYRNYYVDKAGLWTVRVSSRDGTSGTYSVRVKTKAAKPLVFRNVDLGGPNPVVRVFPFPGVNGGTLSASLDWSAQGSPVDMLTISGPDELPVLLADGSAAVDARVKKGRRVSVAGVPLTSGDGAYSIRVRTSAGTARTNLTITVKPPTRVSAKKPIRLSDTEPFLDVRAVPLAADPGETVVLTGSGFSTKKAPRVFFGDRESPSVTVNAEGTELTVVVPEKGRTSFVAVYVVNTDGQGTGRDAYFAFVPAPVVTELADNSNSQPVRTSSTNGGRVVRLTGANFGDGYVVRVGDVVVAAPILNSETEFRFTLPAVEEGFHHVTVTDPFLRTAESDFEVRYKTPPSFDLAPYSPSVLRVQTGTTLTVTGANFLETDRFTFAGEEIAHTWLDENTLELDLAPLAAGAYSLAVVDEIGTTVQAPNVVVKRAGSVTGVSVVSGPAVGTMIPLTGGSVVRVDGSSFDASDEVTLGGATIDTFVTNTSTRKEFAAPADLLGPVELVITDGAGQVTTVADAITYAGFADDTTDRHPSTDGTDDFGAKRIALGDLDGDGLRDDVVLVSPLGASPGTREELTRVLAGGDDGAFSDVTGTAIPAVRSDIYGVDTWDADCVAVGDLDGNGADDIILGGQVVAGSQYYPQVRILEGDGAGLFTPENYYVPPMRYGSYVPAFIVGTYGYYAAGRPLYGFESQRGSPQAIAIGDVDGDDDLDLVVGTDHYQARGVYYDPSRATYSYVTGYYGGFYAWVVNPAYTVSYTQYRPATRVYENRLSSNEGFRDDIANQLPAAGTSQATTAQPSALHCRDLALADVDGDTDLDLVVAWDDPLTVTPYGMSTFEATGASSASPSIATRVLLNDGHGSFATDATTTWMPTPSYPDYWHATRVVMADLNGDSRPEMILVLSRSLDAWTGTATKTRRALRILRNDTTRFTDVTSSALPALKFADQDDFRGDAIAVRDVNGDGDADLVVVTSDELVTVANKRRTSCRTFFGAAGLTFVEGSAFSVAPATDTCAAGDLLFTDDLDASGVPVLVITRETTPTTSPDSRKLRTETFQR